MEIILQGGPLDGQGRTVTAVERQYSEDGWVYKIADGVFKEGRQVFKFDEKASLERHRREANEA